MFPTNSERLIGISDAFSAFAYGYPSSCPRAHCTPNKSVTTLRYTRRHGPVYIYIQAMPVGTYRVQSPGFPKIVYCCFNSCAEQSHKDSVRKATVEEQLSSKSIHPAMTAQLHFTALKSHLGSEVCCLCDCLSVLLLTKKA